jgi:hypothetical protein
MRLASEMLITSFNGKPQESLIELAGGDGSPLNDNAGRATRTTAYARLQSKSCGQRGGSVIPDLRQRNTIRRR